MIKVVEKQQEFIRQCKTCMCSVSYVYTDTNIRKVRASNPTRFYAYRYVECPLCKNDIEH